MTVKCCDTKDGEYIIFDEVESLLIAYYYQEMHNNSSILLLIQNDDNYPHFLVISYAEDCKCWLKRQGFDFSPTEEQLVEFKLKYL